MDFAAVMLITQQDFHLECLFFLGVFLILEIVTISDVYKKACNVFQSSKNEEITLPHEVYFCVYPIFHWGDIVGKVLPKAWGSEKI